MAHLPPSTAIFSPSVARAAASAAKDWSYVDAWLHRKFLTRGPPPFERNADTLRVLLALASANEAADEERTLVARLEAETLAQLKAHDHRHLDSSDDAAGDDGTLESAREAILTSLESSLTREGQAALTAMASLSLQTGTTAAPTPATLGAELISLSSEVFALEQDMARVQALTAYMARESDLTANFAAELEPPPPHDPSDAASEEDPDPDADPSPGSASASASVGYHPPATLSLQNLSTQRHIKSLLSRLPDLREKAASLAATSSSTPTISIPQVRQEEAAYLSLLSQKKALDTQVRAFAGLPPDTEQARQTLESLRSELRRLTRQRDEVFEGLVERETPRKGRAPPRR